MPNYLTFKQIYEGICLAMGDGQYTRALEVKAVVNMIYLNEICQCDELYPLFWLYDVDDAKRSKAPVTAITSITKATPPVVTSVAHKRVTGDLDTFYDVTGMTELENMTCHVTRLTADTYSLQDLNKTDIPGLGYGAAGTHAHAHHRGTLITSCKRILHANWHNYKDMDPISPKEIADDTQWMSDTTSVPVRRLHRQVFKSDGTQLDYLIWHYGNDAARSLYLQYEKQPDRLSTDSDVPIGPPQVGDAIIAGSVMRLGVNATQVEAGVVWPSIYQSNIQAIKNLNRSWWENFKPSERAGLYLP
jgi:hypothetical protein